MIDETSLAIAVIGATQEADLSASCRGGSAACPHSCLADEFAKIEGEAGCGCGSASDGLRIAELS